MKGWRKMRHQGVWQRLGVVLFVSILLMLIYFPAGAEDPKAPTLRFALVGANAEQGGVWAIVENGGEVATPAGTGWRLWRVSPSQTLVAKGELPPLDPGASCQVEATALTPGTYRFYLLPSQGAQGIWSEEIVLAPGATATPTAAEPTPLITPTLAVVAATPYPEALTATVTPAPHLIAIPLIIQPAAGPSPTAAPLPTAAPMPTPSRVLPPLAFLAPVARQASTEHMALTLGNLSGDKALTLQGYVPSAAVYSLLEEGASASAGRLRIRFRHSATLQPDSTLTVKVNRIPVASVRLTQENAEGGEIAVEIPPAALTGDTIEIGFSGFLQTTEDICSLLDDESAWVTILPDSEIAFTVSRPPFQPNLGRLPYPFVRERTPQEQAVIVVLADELDAADWAAALPLAGYLGRASAWRDLPIYAVRESEFNERLAAQYDLIFVGRSGTLNILGNAAVSLPLGRAANGTILGPDGNPLAADTGVIMETPSPWDAHRGLLVVTGGTMEALRRAVQALVQPAFPSEARGEYALILQAPAEEPPIVASGRLTHTLESLGYDDLVMQGVGRQTRDVTLVIPSALKVESARLRVRFSHSPFLWQKVSYLNVYLNDVPVKGVYLDERNEERGEVLFDIRGDQFVPGKNILRFLFDLRLEDWDCREAEWARAWGTIHRDTLLTLDLGPGDGTMDLAGFPGPYTGGALWILPDRPSPETMAGTFLLMAQLGRELGEDILYHRLTVASQAPRADLEKQNVIAVGLPAENPILAEVADKLPYPLGALSSSGAIQGAKPVGAVEQIASPWNARYRLLVISGANDELVGRAAYLLSDTRQRPRLRGEVALVDADGVVTTIATQARPTPVPGRAIGTRATPSWVTIVALGALAVLVVLIGIAVVRRLAQRGAGRKGPAA